MIKWKRDKGSIRDIRNEILVLMLLSLLIVFKVSSVTSEGSEVLIIDFYACDRFGNPQDSFPIGATAHFNVTVRNLMHNQKNITISLDVLDELGVLICFDQLITTITADTSTHYIMDVVINQWAHVGIATAYVYVCDGSVVEADTANFHIGPKDLTLPLISLLYPENVTYETNTVPLVFTVDERTCWTGYSLNNIGNVSITGNTTLQALTNGFYSVIVYANDTSGNMGSSEELHFTVLILHDLSITDLKCSPKETYIGRVVNITTSVLNEGCDTETFDITAYVNSAPIEMLRVTISPGSQITIVFTLSTASFSKGNYTISVHITPIPGEKDTSDNDSRDAWLAVTVLGDVDSDFDVDIYDVIKLCGTYGCSESDPTYDLNCDLNCDGVIDLYDLALASNYYGET
jgi:hypothetical protein